MADLKPCPFCGHPAEQEGETVACTGCPCTVTMRLFPGTVAAAWNTRACPECDRQRERANAAALQADGMVEELARHYQLVPDLQAALGVEGLSGDAQVEAALKRVAAMEAVLDAALSEWDAYASNDCTAGRVNIAMRNLHGALYRAAPKHFDEQPLRVTPECPGCLRLRARNAALEAVAGAGQSVADAWTRGDGYVETDIINDLVAALAALEHKEETR